MSKPIINGLLISAGLSGRMGQFKPLILYKGKSFVVTIVEKLLSICERVVVVTGFQKDKIEAIISSQFSTLPAGRQVLNSQFLKKVNCIYNPNFDKGMFTSLQVGLKELKDSDWIIYHFVDQPFHEEKFYKELISQIDNNYDWIQPCYKGMEGHPVLFKKNIFEKILTADPFSSLRLIRDDGGTKGKNWDCSYSQILNDFDTQSDIEKFNKINNRSV
ncbi:MAG: NTP transferase domain-containing protein [Melioribacteraceae bacterium]